jgi:hypothetical protein
MTGKEEVVTLGERRYVQIGDGATVQHDYWLMGHVTRAGLARVTMFPNETPDQFCLRILDTAIMSGLVMELMGGLLVPEGTKPADWTPEMAVETGAYISGLSHPEDKEKINDLLLTMLMDFFERGLTSLYRTDTSSAAGQPGQTEAAH